MFRLPIIFSASMRSGKQGFGAGAAGAEMSCPEPGVESQRYFNQSRMRDTSSANFKSHAKIHRIQGVGTGIGAVGTLLSEPERESEPE